jgi:hypothetical protein
VLKRERPNVNSIAMDIVRNESAGIPLNLTKIDKNSVKKVKLRINPSTTPKGLYFFPSPAEDKIMGSRGSIQGDRTVTIPAKNANVISNIIFTLS